MLHLHRSERAGMLVEPLARLLAEPAEDPFAAEVVAVPTPGVERWLAQRLSHRLGAGTGGDGVCARVDFPSPARLVGDLLATLAGTNPDLDPWRPDRLAWPLLEVLDDVLGEPWAAPLARYLGPDERRRGRRLALAQRLARLLAGYGMQRPDLLLAWTEHGEGPTRAWADGAGGAVPEDLAWQPELWCRLRERVGEPSPAERLPTLLENLRADPGAAGLPPRLSVFGPTRLPEHQLRVLTALAARREVHLWLCHPSPALWERVAAEQPAPGPVRRRERAPAAHHPLLASTARDVTELQQRLHQAAPRAAEQHHRAPEPPATLLGALQRQLRADAPARFQPAEEDRSIQIHACHGLSRQVEVLRELLLGLLADDPSLEPRDILVMCPDVEAVAPLVTATFGLATAEGEGIGAADTAHPGHRLRVRLADRAPGATNPVLGLLAGLLRLADGRITASEVLDLAASPPVRARFAFTEEELDRLRAWAVSSGVRWGEDERRRARFGLDGLRQGTWDVALDRLLLGVAMAEEDYRFLGAALPLDDVDSTDVDLAGRLAELLDRLGGLLRRLEGPRPLTDWLDALDDALTLLADAPAEDAWQLLQARRILADVRASASGAPELRLADVRAMLDRPLRARPGRAGFRTGAVTVCSMEPMRAVPHRVVVLLGLDEDRFPRTGGTDGDDLLLRDPCWGERDRRAEDRQLFLDALGAAEDHLLILYSGADERTGAPRPPAVPVSELLETLRATLARAGRDGAHEGEALLGRVHLRHPLQPVDERHFIPGALGRPGPFSFDVVAHRAARAGRQERGGRVGRRGPGEPAVRGASGAFLSAPLPPEEPPAEVELEDLVAAIEHPVKWFLRRRLGVSLAGEAEDVEDRLPLTVDPLTSWRIGDRVLAARLAGADRDRALAAEWRRGAVPPRELGRATLLDVDARVEPLARAVLAVRQEAGGDAPAAAVDLAAALPGGRAVVGTVPGVHGDTLVRAVYSRLGPRHRLRAWVQLLALAVGHPGRPWSAVTIGRAPGRRPGALLSRLRAPAPVEARQHLEALLALRATAACEPLPLPTTVGCVYAASRAAGDSVDMALRAAAQEWEDGMERVTTSPSGERRGDEYYALCWGEGGPLGDLLASPSEEERAWWPQEGSRLGVLARRLWQPLLDHETTERP